MASKTTPLTELRPFSVEDPFGTGSGGPSAADRRRDAVRAGRLERQARARRRTANLATQLGERSERRAPRQPRTAAPPVAVAPVSTGQAQSAVLPAATKEAKRGLGCLSTLFFLGLLIAAVNVIIPPILREVSHFWLRETGAVATARIVSLTPTGSTANDKPVYELTLEVRPEGQSPYPATIEQSLDPTEAALLAEGVWVEVRYDRDDPSSVVVIQRVEPTEDPEPTEEQLELEGQEPEAEPSAAEAVAPDEPSSAGVAPADSAIAPACQKAYRCCLAIQPGNTQACSQFLNPDLPLGTCEPSLSAYQRVAAALGKQCEP